MLIFEAKESHQKIWDEFVSQSKNGSFLQSWNWGQLEKKEGKKIWRFISFKDQDQKNVNMTMLLVKNSLPLGYSFLYSPMGPVMGLDNLHLQIGKELMAKIYAISKEEKAIFLRFEPKTDENEKIPIGFEKGPAIQPRDTQVLDISKSEDEILAQMHSKTRYNIRLAERKGVSIRISQNNQKDIDDFYDLVEETSARERIVPHSKEHYQGILSVLGSDMAKLFIAEYKNQAIASAIGIFYGNRCVYVHGASSSEFRNLMAPHLMQWEMIKTAKSQNYKYYDFGGIAPDKADENHPWAGITRFKKSFGGYSEHYLGSIDFPYRQGLYNLYLLRRKLKGRG